jgi:hypothetical protein
MTTYSVDPQHRGRDDVRPAGTLSNGLHVKAPWQSVTEMNGTIQIDNHTGEAATTVRLGNNSTAFVDISVRWRIQPAAADELFLDYRDFDNVRRQSCHPRGEGRAE